MQNFRPLACSVWSVGGVVQKFGCTSYIRRKLVINLFSYYSMSKYWFFSKALMYFFLRVTNAHNVAIHVTEHFSNAHCWWIHPIWFLCLPPLCILPLMTVGAEKNQCSFFHNMRLRRSARYGFHKLPMQNIEIFWINQFSNIIWYIYI